MKSDFSVEYNNDGTWHPALVKDPIDDNACHLTWQDDDGAWHFAKAGRGEGPGEFRAKG